ncbi:hypothetical protein [Neobacillus notoginsengisoli]|uniref:hypothetical protein n=1 Tax=Neobacillus notoginsengisoli TaxID=1578198 RepID=UPI0013147622|nr:hypothetical protein [Neobacillus notoginsengisoli]
MKTQSIRNDDDKIIHVASGSEKAAEKYIEEKAKRFDETNRRLQEAFGKSPRRRAFS